MFYYQIIRVIRPKMGLGRVREVAYKARRDSNIPDHDARAWAQEQWGKDANAYVVRLHAHEYQKLNAPEVQVPVYPL